MESRTRPTLHTSKTNNNKVWFKKIDLVFSKQSFQHLVFQLFYTIVKNTTLLRKIKKKKVYEE